MARMKLTKHDSIKEKAVLAKRSEKIINDFLLQFAYTLLIGVVTIFAFNGIANYSYGGETYLSMTAFMKNAAIIAFVIVFVIDINDTRIKDDKELLQVFPIPVIGSIPDCQNASSPTYPSSSDKSQDRA